MKTESEKIEISKQAAEIVGIGASTRSYLGTNPDTDLAEYKYQCLVDDHGACAEIAADGLINTIHTSGCVYMADAITKDILSAVNVADFSSRIEATNWAICEAVVAQHKESGK